MKFSMQHRAIIGGLIWAGLIASVVLVVRHISASSTDAVQQLVNYATRQRRPVRLELPFDLPLQLGDPVFLAGDNQAKPIGAVTNVDVNLDGRDEVQIDLFGSCPAVATGDHLVFYHAPDSIEWMLETMFHEDKKQELRELIMVAVQDNQAELAAAFKPVIVESLSKASVVVKDDLKSAFAKRKLKWQEIGVRYQEQVLEKKLVPVLQSEVWPIIQSESEPLMTEISREIWQEVSVFGFGWRYIYDRSPLPERNLTEKQFKKFVDEKAKPIIASHVDDFAALQKSIAKQVAGNENVKQMVSQSIRAAANDPEIQQLLLEIFDEVLVRNSRLHETLAQQWRSPIARQAFEVANAKLDPYVRQIGVSLFGSPKDGITPEFAKILRRRILFKDSRWLELHVNDSDFSQARNRSDPFPEQLPVMVSRSNRSAPIHLKGADE